DLFALQLGHDGLHTATTHTNAGADRVDRAIRGGDGDLGARTRVTGDRADGDDTIVDLGHFLHEELRHELRMGAREENLRTALFATHVIDIGTHAVAVAEHFARDQLVAAHDGFATAQIDDHIAIF